MKSVRHMFLLFLKEGDFKNDIGIDRKMILKWIQGGEGV
jgi:hypothetical protein